jgi:hypothetical protein
MTDIPLLPLDDPRWKSYTDGYRSDSDEAISLIQELQTAGTSDEFWERVWNSLHHQGDVGEASYAFVTYLVDYQSKQSRLDERIFHFCVVVDLQQPENGNPPVPPELEFSYALALRALPLIGAQLLRRGDPEECVHGCGGCGRAGYWPPNPCESLSRADPRSRRQLFERTDWIRAW